MFDRFLLPPIKTLCTFNQDHRWNARWSCSGCQRRLPNPLWAWPPWFHETGWPDAENRQTHADNVRNSTQHKLRIVSSEKIIKEVHFWLPFKSMLHRSTINSKYSYLFKPDQTTTETWPEWLSWKACYKTKRKEKRVCISSYNYDQSILKPSLSGWGAELED